MLPPTKRSAPTHMYPALPSQTPAPASVAARDRPVLLTPPCDGRQVPEEERHDDG